MRRMCLISRTRELPHRYVALAVLACLLVGAKKQPAENAVSHRVMIGHPGYVSSPSPTRSLIQRFDEAGRVSDYYLDVDSVFCGTGVCSSVTIRLFWNDIGNYVSFQLRPGTHLTKGSGLPFEESDYVQLQRILKDSESALAKVGPTDIRSYGDEGQHVDGMTHATPVPFRGAAVPGAAWTCFTLWHWANGEVVTTIRRLTAESANVAELRHITARGDESHVVYAIEELRRRKVHDSDTVEIVEHRFTAASREVVEASLGYIESLPNKAFCDSVGRVYTRAGATQRVQMLHHLTRSSQALVAELYELLGSSLPTSASLQEVDLILTILEERKAFPEESLPAMLALLDCDDFLIARRAYWFLSKCKLDEESQRAVAFFRKKNQARL